MLSCWSLLARSFIRDDSAGRYLKSGMNEHALEDRRGKNRYKFEAYPTIHLGIPWSCFLLLDLEFGIWNLDQWFSRLVLDSDIECFIFRLWVWPDSSSAERFYFVITVSALQDAEGRRGEFFR